MKVSRNYWIQLWKTNHWSYGIYQYSVGMPSQTPYATISGSLDTCILCLLIKCSNNDGFRSFCKIKKYYNKLRMPQCSHTEGAYNRCFCFQNYIKYLLGTLIQRNHSLIIKINNFRGDLTDILAVTKTLLTRPFSKERSDFATQRYE